jgi:hypothetical protein
LLERTSKGFRISWTVSQRVRGIEMTHFSEDIIVPWDGKKTLKSISGWTVEAFYSDRPANERRDLVPNHAMERTADRCTLHF